SAISRVNPTITPILRGSIVEPAVMDKLRTRIGEPSLTHDPAAPRSRVRRGNLIWAKPVRSSFIPRWINTAAADNTAIHATKASTACPAIGAAHVAPVVVAGDTAPRK